MPDLHLRSLPLPGLPLHLKAKSPDLAADIAPKIALTLPTPPGYPEAVTLEQVVRARFGEDKGAFEAIVSLSPERVEMVLTAPAGPRLASIVWSKSGIEEDRTVLAPAAIKAVNVLADLFMTRWPSEAIQAALPKGLIVSDDGIDRTISGPEGPIIEIHRDPENPSRTLLRNIALGYEITVTSRSVK
jgi:hypothetical protein